MPYALDLPMMFAIIPLVFHVLMLRKFMGGPYFIVPLKDVTVDINLTYEEASVKILDQQVKRLRNKAMASIKVLKRNQQVEMLLGK